MKVTVCQLHDEPDALPWDWERLVAHTHTEHSDLVLLEIFNADLQSVPLGRTKTGFTSLFLKVVCR